MEQTNSRLQNDRRATKVLGSPMKYIGGRFDKTRYQARATQNSNQNQNDLYELDREALQRASWNKNYSKYNIDEIFAEQGFVLDQDLRKPEWIALYHYDDQNLDFFSLQDWAKKLPCGARVRLLNQAVCKEGDSLSYKSCQVNDYNPENQKFSVHFENGQRRSLKRIFICFDTEDPRIYAKRVIRAQHQRSEADSLIRFLFYIENMPITEKLLPSASQIDRIRGLSNLTQWDKVDPGSLILEIQKRYAQTLNRITFVKFMDEGDLDMLPHHLLLPNQKKNQVNYHGFCQLEIAKGHKELQAIGPNNVQEVDPQDFSSNFKEICQVSYLNQKSLFIKNESVKAIQEIKGYCEEVQKSTFFQTNIDHLCRLEEFKNSQDLHIQYNTFSSLKLNWPNQIFASIQKHFGSITSGPYKIPEKLEDFEKSKLKKFMIMVKALMQDTIFQLTKKSYEEFVSYIKHKVPVKGCDKVTNVYLNQNEKPPEPIFVVDILKSLQSNEFIYSSLPQYYATVIMQVFDKAVTDIQKFQNLECKVINELVKNSDRSEKYLKVPAIPKSDPTELENPTLQAVIQSQENAWLWDLREELRTCIQNGVKPLEEYLTTFDIYKDILSINPIEFAESMNNPEKLKEIHEIQAEIKKVQLKTEEINQKLPDSIIISCFQVQCKDLQQMLLDKYKQINKNLKDVIARRVVKNNDQIYTSILQILHKIRETPRDIEELTALKEYMEQVPSELENIQVEIDKCSEIYTILEQFQYSLSSEDINKRWVVFKGPKDITDTIQQRMEVLNRDAKSQLTSMKLQQEEFRDNIENIEKIISGFHQYKNINMHADVAKMARNINDQLKSYQENAKLFNSRENLFEVEITDYSILGQLTKQFQPYSNLWLITSDWAKNLESWLNNNWEDLDAPAAEKFVEDSLRVLIQTAKQFREKDLPQILKIAEQVKGQLDEFRPKVPLMVALRKQGMKERHWQAISEKVGKDVTPGPGFTFQGVLDLGLMNHVNFCCEIGEKASKEFQIETMLNSMTVIWQDINFELIPFKNTFVIKNYDDINAILDEHIVNTQTMQFSPYKKPFENEILEWYQQIKLVSDILEVWAKTQGQYMYLQPIFDSADIMKQLPGETKKFKAVDQNWKNSIGMAKIVQNVLKVCQTEGLLDRLVESNNNLEIVQKELNNYLEKKREKFARFYFLSNDDLLEILSQTKEPTAVQPHLKKVFENIHEVEFDPAKKILAMYSAEREKIPFVKSINPVGKPVEDWMNELELQMKSTILHVYKESVKDYVNQPRKEWVQTHPGQCVLNGSQVHWTLEVEEAMKQGVPGIKKYWSDVLEHQLKELVFLVRTKLSVEVKIAVNALIVIDVHAKDVVENLWRTNVCELNSFEWISQLRYYQEDDHINVKCVQTIFPYGCEYLGNTMRLVITPLTDKCYMTLMGALKLNLGGAPQGPAGTGKTESTKDLAKAVAILCVVFNCSDQMDYLMVGKFFKGLSASGAWCCFDEFNRINIEVLSVIAQQLLMLFGAKAEGIDRIENFEGSDIRVQDTFCVFITMNPGYAGRSELPDNLKALFRPMAMMVPDYCMIGEILLYSFGFEKGRDLARKMVSTFNLSSKQLSYQFHYDYGMRAVRSVINAAGLLKEKEPDVEEDQILLRALRDVNVPKFLKDDLPLFENIICDIFPGVQRPPVNYGNLNDSLNNSCKHFNLQPTNVFISKIFELYDTIQVRHGLMLVGPTGGGKSCNWKVLQHAISHLAATEENSKFTKVQVHALNPKSIRMGQLYGEFNDMTREWTDGILAYLVRESVKDLSGEKHWILFDGPVDAIWIESMNTVLDDNKKLCLNSGQILSLTPYMTMMFEVEDLSQASPATVSRCGMVYMEPVALGYQPIIDSWFNTIHASFAERKNFKASFKKIIELYLDPLLEFTRKNCKELVTTIDNNLVLSLLKIINSFFMPFIETEMNKVLPEQLEQLEKNLEGLFIYAATWSIGCTTDYDGRLKFNTFFLELLKKNSSKYDLQDNVYGCNFDHEKGVFYSWSEDIKNFEIEKNMEYSQIMVPTMDYQRNIFLMKLLLTNSYHVMCVGPTGTGKSQNAYDMLQKKLGETYQFISITFSAQTSANQTQDTIDSKTDKRRRGIFGPPLQKKLVIFVDDLNMPKKETYGAQPPIEILRQFLDYQGWYNRKELVFRLFEDMVMITAMGPPGGGKSVITSRMVRQFNLLAYTELDNTAIKSIFNQLSGYFFKNFPDNIKEVLPQLIDQVLVVYEKVRNELLPTPTKSHYLFNLRDISKVFQGVCLSHPKIILEKQDLVRLWYHENMRVFHDRLIDDADRNYFKNILKEQNAVFELKEEDVMNCDRIIYGDFYEGKDGDNRNYRQFDDIQYLIQKLYDFQDEYNQEYPKGATNLILFVDACEHVCRITRVLRQPMGNALLLGVGGSGRQSLSRLSCFIANQKIFQIEVTKSYNMKSWRDDMRTMLMEAGIENKNVTFLFVDTQIINEQMLEDINNILNSGDITNLYGDKELEDITNACKAECMQKGLQPNKMNIFSTYISRVKKNIHIVICMSPLSDMFATRLRMFPSLITCCTLDWFCEWPEDALLGVGKGQIIDDAQKHKIEDLVPQLCEMFKRIHKSVEMISVRFKDELRRVAHVTPKSFLEQLSIFKIVLDFKISEMKHSIQRLKNGLDKLEQANKEVDLMQIILKEKQPQLEKASIETDEMLVVITVDKKAADEKQIIVASEEAEATKQTEEATRIKEKCEQSVAKANADLQEIIQKVNLLTDAHITEIKSMNNPSAACRLIMGGLVILMLDYIKEEKKGKIVQKADPDNPFGKKQNDYFATAKTYLLSEPKVLLYNLKNYKKESLNPSLIVMLEKEIMPSADFTQQRANDCSLAVSFIFMWINAMYTFFKVFTETQPLRDELKRVEAIVEEKTAILKVKKDELDAINSRLLELENKLNEKVAYKKQLQDDIQDCIVKLERAQKLVVGLSDEQKRWGKEIEIMEKNGENTVANCIIAAGMISYAGPFTSNYRQQLESSWCKSLLELELKHTPNVTMRDFMGVPVVIQGWNLSGLPKDDTSTENGIIIEKSRRFTLMIDPQNQANKFIKNWGKERPEGIEVVKNGDPNLIRVCEKAIQFGQWVLLENVQQELDASLEPILQQDIKKSGSGYTIALGEKVLNYDERFRIYFTTTISNPIYSPETSVKVTIINFAITPGGLEEQMLAQIVAIENPQLEFKKSEIVKRNALDKKELLKIEDSILKSLSEIQEINDMLKDETMIDQLANSKKFAQEINQRVAESKITEKEIDQARESFRPVAFRASLLFFCILDLSNIDPMYQYSLQWYIKLFQNGVQNSPTSNEHEQRLLNLNNYFTYSLYENVCRSLFEKHKLLFSLLLCNKILAARGDMDAAEWRYLLVGPSGDLGMEENPTSWIAGTSWNDIYLNFAGLSQLEAFKDVKNHFMQNSEAYRNIYDSNNAHEEPCPEPFQSSLNQFQKLLLLKCLRPDKLIPGIQNFIAEKLGKEYIISPPFDLSKCYRDSAIETPLIFVLSAGSDPVADFKRFAEEQGMSKRFQSISLGQGQGPKAEKMIREEQVKGGWVLLQNCHLSITWCPVLEKLVEELNDQLHRDFRLWLTSMPDPQFPISVLQNSVKMTLEPPKGLRANLLRSYQNLDDKELNNCKNPDAFKKLLFGFCLFHAIIQERRKFGAIGWNVSYDFTNEDLNVCKRQLKLFLDEYDEIPYKVINYLGSEINYGGRVTNDKDKLLISEIIKTYIRPEALNDNFAYSQSGIYYSPPAEDQASYLKYIESLPLNPQPEAFGLHENADITNAQNETRMLLENVLSIQPRESSGSGKSREELIEEIAIFIQEKTPPAYDLEQVFKQYPTDYNESMNTVLIQECIRYNGVLIAMKGSIIELKKALKGLIVMSEDLENIANSLYSNQVPVAWEKKSFNSLKPLSSWVEDLNNRINFINNWIKNGTPEHYWISGFFFPQAFITGVMQNFARKYTIAVDQIIFDFLFLDQMQVEDIKKRPENGCYVYGLFFEGAQWCKTNHMLIDSNPKELFSECPIIQMVPVKQDEKKPFETPIYQCPLYKTVSRKGELSTTGHCTNFVMFFEVTSDRDQTIWIKAGVALFLALRY